VTDRLHLDYLISASALSAAELEPQGDLYQGLTQQPKTIPARYFYDAKGSALFEQICDLPEYYVTRTETAIFQACAIELATLTGSCEIVELGSGSSTKTRILLDAYQQQLEPGSCLQYCPIDVSGSILEASARTLLRDYDDLHVNGLVSTYDLALSALPPTTAPNRLICFIGSSLGNFAPVACEAFLGRIAQALQIGEYFLLGIDLRAAAAKPMATIVAAYDDAQGVTAAFNRNLLQHLNDRFAADFQLDQFEHVALYNTELDQIEMHLRSRSAQTVRLAKIDLTLSFEPGEMILSEISRKFNLNTMPATLMAKKLAVSRIWTDSQAWFGVILCRKI
jgi:L-histidine Nalpha-methyltransferase